MKVLLADDHNLFREGLRMILADLIEETLEVIEVKNFPLALAAIEADNSVDIALVDFHMPGMDGVSGIEALKRLSPDLHVIVVSGSEEADDMRRALEAGAVGYISKASSSAVMVGAIRAVLNGEAVSNTTLPEASARPLSQACQALTPRQKTVLIMAREGKTNKEIARELDLAEITIKLHMTAILRTLGVGNRTQAAIKALNLPL